MRVLGVDDAAQKVPVATLYDIMRNACGQSRSGGVRHVIRILPGGKYPLNVKRPSVFVAWSAVFLF